MANLSPLRKLLWTDGIAALLSGLIVLTFNEKIAKLLSLPENLLTTMSIVSLVYSSFSLYLAQAKSNTRGLLTILVVANSMYAIFCLVLILFLYRTTSVLGITYLILESLFVATLAALEWREVKQIETIPRQYSQTP